jgi:acetyl esterase/lipase
MVIEMKRVLTGLVAILLSISGLLFAAERSAKHSGFDVGRGDIVGPDGRPGSLLARHIQAAEDDLSDVAVRKLCVIYGRKFGTALTMDIYEPKSNSNGTGIIHIVSGGLWSGPEYRRMPSSTRNIRALIDNGHTVFAVMHSSLPKFSLLDICHDVPRSVRYVRYHADRFGIRPGQIGMIGYSSGGHLALLAATADTDGGLHPDDPVDTVSSKLQAVVAYFPDSDLLNYGEDGKLMSQHFREWGFKLDSAFDFQKWDEDRFAFVPMTEQETRVAFRNISPLTHVSRDDPPTLLFHGDEDEFVPIQQSRVFERRMKDVGAHCELVVAKGEGHGWKEPLPGERERVGKWFDRYLVQGSEGVGRK